eukprot:13339464-Ditylum_brightwellii.AAC.1
MNDVAGWDPLGNHVDLPHSAPVGGASDVVPTGYNDGGNAVLNASMKVLTHLRHSPLKFNSAWVRQRNCAIGACIQALKQHTFIALPSAIVVIFLIAHPSADVPPLMH